jgi:hypothetical protein
VEDCQIHHVEQARKGENAKADPFAAAGLRGIDCRHVEGSFARVSTMQTGEARKTHRSVLGGAMSFGGRHGLSRWNESAHAAETA